MSQEIKNVSKKVKQGVFYTVLTRLSGTFFQFFGSIILARTLAVEDFGVVQMGMMVIGFATKLGEFGFNLGLIQRQEKIHTEHVNTLFVIDFAFKLALFTIVLYCTPFLMEYFNEPRLRLVMPAIALYMVLDCFSNPGNTILKRRMDFQKHSQVKIIERFIEIFSSVALALAGFNIWSLILSKILAVAISAVMASRAAGWRPSFNCDFADSKEMITFGGWVFLRNLMKYLSNNVDYFFVSRYLGTTSLGHYTRAFDLMRLPQRRISRAFNSVMFSAFSRVQDQPEKIKSGFSKVILTVSLVSYPLLIAVMIIAPEFIRLVYGEKWIPMTIPLQIMCLSGILRSIDPFLNSVITATGYVKHTALRRFVEFGLLAIATFIGVSYGIIGVAISVVIVSVIIMVLMVSLLQKVSTIGWRDFMAPQLPALGASFIMAAAMLAIRYVMVDILAANQLFLLLSMVSVGVISYSGTLLLCKPKQILSLKDEIAGDLSKITKKYRKKLNSLYRKLGFVHM